MIPISTNSKQNFRTPQWLQNRLELKTFDVDAAADKTNHVCHLWYGPGGIRENALTETWAHPLQSDRWIFCNPPYMGEERACKPDCKKRVCKRRGFCLAEDYPGIGGWLHRGMEAAANGDRVLFLLPANVGTRWFEDYSKFANVTFITPRVAFCSEGGTPMKNPPHSSMLMEFTRKTVHEGGVWKVERIEP